MVSCRRLKPPLATEKGAVDHITARVGCVVYSRSVLGELPAVRPAVRPSQSRSCHLMAAPVDG